MIPPCKCLACRRAIIYDERWPFQTIHCNAARRELGEKKSRLLTFDQLALLDPNQCPLADWYIYEPKVKVYKQLTLF